MESLQDFVIAINLESWEAFEDALAGFERSKDVRGNGTVEIGYLSKTIKPLGLGIGKALAAAIDASSRFVVVEDNDDWGARVSSQPTESASTKAVTDIAVIVELR